MMTKQRISVLMPVRNGERWLREAVNSILKQTYSGFELLAIDDGSSDLTPEILEQFQKSDPRVKIVRQDKLGLVAALNNGLANAQGNLIARLDADDVAFPQRLEKQVALFDSHPNLLLLGTWADKIDESGNSIGTLKPESEDEKLRLKILKTNPFIHSSVVFSAEVARRCGGYRRVFEAAEDFDLWLRMSERGDISIIPEALIKYRIHAGGVSTKLLVRQLFSARLAISSAKSRRLGKVDPAEQFLEPPNWNNAAESHAVFKDASIYRVIQYATESSKPNLSKAEIRFACSAVLNHAEKKLAQLAILNILRRRADFSYLFRVELMIRLFCLHPGRAIEFIFGARGAGAKKSDFENSSLF